MAAVPHLPSPWLAGLGLVVASTRLGEGDTDQLTRLAAAPETRVVGRPEFVDVLGQDLQDESCPPEGRSRGRTITRWRCQIVAWHQALVSNGPTEAGQ